MEFIFCPVCSRAISKQAVVEACPQCYHPLDVQAWIEVKAKKDAKELAEKEERAKTHVINEKLKTIPKVGLIDAYNEQKRTGGWTFYNENDIVQRTLENRFNFLLVVYTLFIAAYFQADKPYDKLFILIIAFVLVGFLFLAIFRTKNRFNITLDITHSLEPDDVGPIIHKENQEKHKHPFNKLFRNNTIPGFYIPLIMFATIVGGLIYHIFIKGAGK